MITVSIARKSATIIIDTFLQDFVDPALTTFTKSLVDTYNSIPWDESECGYACSDHASWNRQGYPSAFPFETRFGEDNPRIHGTGDTVNVTGFSWTHSLEYAKLAVAFAYELGA
jgi:leucyl aminopeptidase